MCHISPFELAGPVPGKATRITGVLHLEIAIWHHGKSDTGCCIQAGGTACSVLRHHMAKIADAKAVNEVVDMYVIYELVKAHPGTGNAWRGTKQNGYRRQNAASLQHTSRYYE